jgi:hypothetical protein
MGQPGKAAILSGQHRAGTIAIHHAGRVHRNAQNQPGCINEKVALAAMYLLAAVIAMGPLFPSSSPIGYRG